MNYTSWTSGQLISMTQTPDMTLQQTIIWENNIIDCKHMSLYSVGHHTHLPNHMRVPHSLIHPLYMLNKSHVCVWMGQRKTWFGNGEKPQKDVLFIQIHCLSVTLFEE